ncbi:MAG: DUF4912 domain-containing protein [Pirellulaceae bacterium]
MYTAATLRERTVKDLGKLAAKFGVTGWRAMRKEELVGALVRAAKKKAEASSRTSSKTTAKRNTKKGASASRATPARRSGNASGARRKAKPKQTQPKSPRVVAQIQRANAERERRKSLATPAARRKNSAVSGTNNALKAAAGNGRKPVRKPATLTKKGATGKERVVLLVRGAYWLQAVWELNRHSIERAEAAMAEQWHTAKPVLRLIEAGGGATTSAVEHVVRDIAIHGGVSTWFIDVPGDSKSYRVDIGYLGVNGKYFSLARSNTITTPRPSNGNAVIESWSDIAEDCEKIYALSGGYSGGAATAEIQELFEERLGRSMGGQVGARFGVGADKMLHKRRDFLFEVDAELIVYGATRPNAYVTLAGTPVKLRADGSFTARLSMPNRRQVLPVVASSADGVEQRTVVLAVERNTKIMEPQIREAHEQ